MFMDATGSLKLQKNMINEFHFNTSQFDLYNSCKSACVTSDISYLQCKYTLSRIQEFGYYEHPATMSIFFSPKIRLLININITKV